MRDRIITNLRKWISLIVAVIIFYLVHEGAHLIVALIYGVFDEVKFMRLGVQVAIDDTALTNLQLAILCVVGSIATLICAYALVALTKSIVNVKSKYFRATCYYTTFVMLMLDPIYLTILYRFFGGGDMNGIVLFGIPEIAAELVYGVIGIVNLVVFIKRVYPKYKESFSK